MSNLICLDRISYCGIACSRLNKRKAVAHSPNSTYVTLIFVNQNSSIGYRKRYPQLYHLAGSHPTPFYVPELFLISLELILLPGLKSRLAHVPPKSRGMVNRLCNFADLAYLENKCPCRRTSLKSREWWKYCVRTFRDVG